MSVRQHFNNCRGTNNFRQPVTLFKQLSGGKVCEFASLASKDEDPTVVKHLHFVLEFTAAEVKRYKDLQG
jgi:hypothetical protein